MTAHIDRMFDRHAPHSRENECALLGAMILDGRVIPEAIEILQGPEDFYSEKNGFVYSALIEMSDRAEAIEMPQLKQLLSDKGQLVGIGGVDYIIELAESVPSSVSMRHYAKIVADKAVLRRFIDTCAEGINQAYKNPVGHTEHIDKIEAALYQLSDKRISTSAEQITPVMNKLRDVIAERMERGGALSGMSTGFQQLDHMTSGLHPGEVFIIGARPSVGKTSLMLNMAESMAMEQHIPTAIFTIEMTNQQIAQRLMCSRAGIDSQVVRNNRMNQDQVQAMNSTIDTMNGCPLWLDDTSALNPTSMRSKARRLVAKNGVKVIFIDYMQLMTCPGVTGKRNESRQQEVSEISRQIKQMAKDLSVPVVCMCQLNRGVEYRSDHKPMISDLRESGTIEQDADVVALLHRERDDGHYRDDGELIIAKQRNGPTGSIPLHFDGGQTRFSERIGSTPGFDRWSG